MSVNPNALTIIVVFFVIASGVIMGCSSTQVHENKGITVNNASELGNISFEFAVQSIADTTFDQPGSNSTDTVNHILLIRGSRLDVNGDASDVSGWFFFVRHTNQTYGVNVDRNGNSIAKWGGEAPDHEILIDQVMHPRELFTRNMDLIVNKTSPAEETRDLTLSDGNYTLTITSGNSVRVLTFDATTGALTNSHG